MIFIIAGVRRIAEDGQELFLLDREPLANKKGAVSGISTQDFFSSSLSHTSTKLDSQLDISTDASMLLESVRVSKMIEPRSMQPFSKPTTAPNSSRQQLRGGFSVDLALNPSCKLLS